MGNAKKKERRAQRRKGVPPPEEMERIFKSIALAPETAVTEHSCPYCGTKIDGLAPINALEEAAGAEDVPRRMSVCCNCEEIIVYDEKLQARRATDVEMAAMRGEPETWETLENIRLMARRRRAKLRIAKAHLN